MGPTANIRARSNGARILSPCISHLVTLASSYLSMAILYFGHCAAIIFPGDPSTHPIVKI
jgi:hypothetical protein